MEWLGGQPRRELGQQRQRTPFTLRLSAIPRPESFGHLAPAEIDVDDVSCRPVQHHGTNN